MVREVLGVVYYIYNYVGCSLCDAGGVGGVYYIYNYVGCSLCGAGGVGGVYYIYIIM